jgi:hypothetical protein
MDKATKILKELERRNKPINLLEHSFPEQTTFINDPAKMKSALTTRRAGKSYAAGLMLFQFCLANPNAACAYIGLTRETAKNVMVDPILKKINRTYKTNAKFYKSPAKISFPNGSYIIFFGINDTDEEREKLLGQHYKLVVIDEGASYTIDLKTTIKDFVLPTLTDDDGQLVIIGTPGNLRNYFCDISENRIPGWSNHFWTANENPHVSANWNKDIAKLKLDYPNIEDDPGFQQHYRGQWTIDTTKKAYKCSINNYITTLPIGDYRYLLGMDLGQVDENAWVVGAYSEHDPTLYLVESFSKNNMLMDDWIAKLNDIESRYPISTWIIDASNKQYVEELRYRTKRPFQNKPGGGQDKMKYVYMMNSDFILNKIKVIATKCESLIKEYDYLVLNDDPIKPKILGGDHNADAALYLWRYSFHYNSVKPVEIIKTKEDIQEEWWEKEAEKIQGKKDKPFWESDWT